jgi:hypothetical protein
MTGIGLRIRGLAGERQKAAEKCGHPDADGHDGRPMIMFGRKYGTNSSAFQPGGAGTGRHRRHRQADMSRAMPFDRLMPSD